jgi:thermostable 8-oxoguanine DNA glycosylase
VIYPDSITQFDRSKRELQAFWLFCVSVAGRNADMVAKKVNELMDDVPNNLFPFDWLWMVDVRKVLEKHKMGQYGRITRAIEESVNLDLNTATLDELMQVHGVGPKTARFFLLHSRKGAECAVLDVHILRFIRANGYPDVPESTPQSVKTYNKWEQIFLDLCAKLYPDMTIAEADLTRWIEGRK